MQISTQIEAAYKSVENLLFGGAVISIDNLTGMMAGLLGLGPRLTGVGIEVTGKLDNGSTTLELVVYLKSGPGLPPDLRTFFPPPFPNVRVRWRETGSFKFIESLTAIPLPGAGVAIGAMRTPFPVGTLGAVVKDSNGRQFLLSCNHVIALNKINPTEVIYPGNQAGLGGAADHAIATCTLPPPWRLTAGINSGDFAIAELKTGVFVQAPGHPDIPSVKFAKPMTQETFLTSGHTKPLLKLGAATQVTQGIAIAPKASFLVDLNVAMDIPTAVSLKFDKQYLVRGVNASFADHGDSGSLVVTADGEAVGVLFAKNDLGEGIVCPIDKYFSDLDLSFPI